MSVSAAWVSVSAGWVSVSVGWVSVSAGWVPILAITPNMTFDLQWCCTSVVVVATFFTSCTLPPPPPQVKLLLIRVTPGVVCGVVFVIACVLVYLLQHDVFQWAEYL